MQTGKIRVKRTDHRCVLLYPGSGMLRDTYEGEQQPPTPPAGWKSKLEVLELTRNAWFFGSALEDPFWKACTQAT